MSRTTSGRPSAMMFTQFLAHAGLVTAIGAGAWSLGCGAPGEPPPSAGGAEASASEATMSQQRSSSVDREGWITLFDGSGLDAWRGYRREDVPDGWRVEEGVLAFVPGGDGGDLITRDTFGDFELELEWRVAPGSNSGIFYRGTEEADNIYETAPEMQVLDNARHADGRSPLTSAGANYGLYPAERDVTRPVGEWNRVRIVARGDHVEHWLNGEKIVEYELGSDDWLERVRSSKFAAWPGYGRRESGHIGVQDHGDRVWFRDIRVRRLNGSGD